MAIAASTVLPTNSLEDFRIEFNNLVSDVSGITATNKFTENIIFEGATADDYETTLTVTDPTADRTITIPNVTGTVSLLTATETLTNKTLTSPVINTATVGTSIVPASADGATLGSASSEWSDIYLSDAAVIYFGNDQEVKITHDDTDGLTFKCETTDRPFLLTLQSGDTDISDGDGIGRITFQAPDEATGTDANAIAAEIKAVATQDFSASVNKTALLFMTGSSEAATEKWRITDTGKLLAAGSTVSLDMNAGELILDADADTSNTSDTDDQIDFKISGADDFRMTANTFTVLSGSTLSISSGATITAASGSTLNGFGTDASATALAIALG